MATKKKVDLLPQVRIEVVKTKIGNRELMLKKPRIYFDKEHPASKSKTHQSFREEVKISTIMKNYKKTGILGDQLSFKKPQYGDFTGVDFTEMQRKVADARSQFDQLPAELRSKFKNRVENLIDYLLDEKNEEEAVKLGLKQNKRLLEPYMMVDKNGQPTGVMKHPGPTAKEHKYFKNGVQTDKFGNTLPEPPKEGGE